MTTRKLAEKWLGNYSVDETVPVGDGSFEAPVVYAINGEICYVEEVLKAFPAPKFGEDAEFRRRYLMRRVGEGWWWDGVAESGWGWLEERNICSPFSLNRFAIRQNDEGILALVHRRTGRVAFWKPLPGVKEDETAYMGVFWETPLVLRKIHLLDTGEMCCVMGYDGWYGQSNIDFTVRQAT